MPDSPPSNLGRILAFAEGEDWGFDSYEYADWLWLWQIQCEKGVDKQSSTVVADEEDQTTSQKVEDQESTNEETQSPESAAKSEGLPVTLPETPDDASQQQQEESSSTSEPTASSDDPGLPISVPDTATLQQTLPLNRSARPLIRRIASATEKELNIPKTVRETAEISLNQKSLTIIPTYQPKLIRALDAIVLVETHRSMLLWEKLQAEAFTWLSRLGAFRDIRVCGLTYETQKNNALKVQITPSLRKNAAIQLEPESLQEPRGKRVIFLFSDATSPAWYAQVYNQVLRNWGKRQMVCLLSPFPETLWAKTALGKGIEVSLNQSLAYRPSQQWQINNRDSLVELDFRFETKRQKQQYLKDCLRLPVLNLTPQSLSAWSGVVDGDPNCSCAGYLLDVPDDSVSTTDLPAPSYQSHLSPEQVQNRLRFFDETHLPKLGS